MIRSIFSKIFACGLIMILLPLTVYSANIPYTKYSPPANVRIVFNSENYGSNEYPIYTKSFQIKYDVTNQVQELMNQVTDGSIAVYVLGDIKLDNGKWLSEINNFYLSGPMAIPGDDLYLYESNFSEFFSNGELPGGMDYFNEHTVYFRLKFHFMYTDYNNLSNSTGYDTTWSEVITFKNSQMTDVSEIPVKQEAVTTEVPLYSGASDWAKNDLNKAVEYGLITEKIKDNMSEKITREEFAEIVVKLYEKYTGNSATIGNQSFVDTTNPEILKAANLDLVAGTGNNKYEPFRLVSREEMATILLRALKVIKPSEDFLIESELRFADDNKVASWAREGVYYCYKVGIVEGIGGNLFNPNGTASREVAVIVCKRAYEYYNK
jgi:hypothetical protein